MGLCAIYGLSIRHFVCIAHVVLGLFEVPDVFPVFFGQVSLWHLATFLPLLLFSCSWRPNRDSRGSLAVACCSRWWSASLRRPFLNLNNYV